MAVSIIEKVLGNNKFHTDTYIKETITLIKSISIKNDKEARLYNEYIKLQHPAFVEGENRREWCYYLHLVGQPHRLDRSVVAVSVDNAESFVLDKASMLVHRRTHEELLKFGLYYEELVRRFPELELYIKGVITTPLFTDVQAIVESEDFTIVSYDKGLVESNEHDLVSQLQLRLNSYQATWLIGFYAMADNLFIASQYHILYNFLVTSLLAIRLANAKTVNAHSYHIRLYLASHHYLDDAMLFLTKSQQLFLYRNMLYLDNHAGSNFTFQTLIDVLFSERNISVVNYVYHQRNSVNEDGLINYRYRHKLLNSKPLVISASDMSLEAVGHKERPLAPGNSAVYDYNIERIDFKHRNSLFSELLTKDLETILLDETDSVKYKLLQTLTDYWARLLADNRVNFITEVTDPTSSLTTRLSARDLFKLYLIVLYASQGISIDQFPIYRIQRVFKQTPPDVQELLAGCYDMDVLQRQYIQDVINAMPGYQYYSTGYQFEQYVTQVYKLNIGLWHLLSNYSDKDTEGQMQWVMHQLHESLDFVVDAQESVSEFLDRTGLQDPRTYGTPQLEIYLFDILDSAYDKKLSLLNRFKKLQDALTKVFFKFNSYTVQLINNYYGDSPLLVGAKDARYSHTDSVYYDLSELAQASLDHDVVADYSAGVRTQIDYNPNSDIDHHHCLRSEVDIDGILDFDIEQEYTTDEEVLMAPVIITGNKSSSAERLEIEMMRVSTFLPVAPVQTVHEVFMESSSRFHANSVLLENTKAILPINVHVGAKSFYPDPLQSSDPDLLFLAFNL